MAYVKLSDVKAGNYLIADGGFTCMPAGPKLVCADNDGGLYVCCAEGQHGLEGQLGEDGDSLIGLYPEGYVLPDEVARAAIAKVKDR